MRILRRINIKYALQHFKTKLQKSNYRSPAAGLDSPAGLGTAVAGVGTPAGEVVLGKHLAVGHTVNFLQDNWRRGKKKKLRSLLN